MAKIRSYYGVPAKRGMRVKYAGHPAVIVSGDGQYLRLRFDDVDATSPYPYHPLYRVDYLDGVDYGAKHDQRMKAFEVAMSGKAA